MEKKWPYVLAGIAVFLYFLFFLNRGITLYDEGYVVESSYLTFLGKIPYKDFYFQYTPLTIWIGALTFKLFGVGVLQLRLVSLLFSLVTVFVGFVIADGLAGKKIAVLSTLALIAWGFPQVNFLWPSPLATLFLFLALLELLNFYKTKKKVYAGFVGLSSALAILTKQNLGLILFVSASVVFLPNIFKKTLRKNALPFFAAFLAVIFLGLLILIRNNLNFSGFAEFFYRSGLVAKGGALLTWYPGLSLSPKTVLYYLPLVFIFYSLFTFAKYKRVEVLNLSIFAICTLFFFTMIWPTADLAHFTFGVPALILAFVTGTQSGAVLLKRLSFFCIIVFLFIGFYKTFFMDYYTFETPYLKFKYSVSVRGEQIIVDEKYFTILGELNREKDTSLKNKSVFVYSYAPMIYFALDKNPPTRELYTVESLLSENAINNVVNDLDKNKVDVILLESWRETPSNITKYIMKNYKETGTVWDFEVLKRI